MSTYIKPGKTLEYDNAPDWLVAYMRYRRTMLGNTPNSVITDFIAMREYLQWLTVYRTIGQSPKTEEELRKVDLLDMSLDTAVQAKRNDVETYLYFCADALNNGEATRSKKLIAVRNFYNYVMDQNEVLQVKLEYNPADRIKNPKAPKKQPIYLPSQERESLLNSISGENAVRDYAILLLLITCGLRVSEVININMKDVNFNSNVIMVHGKGNKERLAFPTPVCIEAMQRYITEYRKLTKAEESLNSPFFVSKRTGQRLTSRSVERMMQKHIQAAGMSGMGYTPHKLRHTMATILAKDGVDLLTIQQILGHESPTTTQIYTHLGNEDLEKAVSKSSLTNLGQ